MTDRSSAPRPARRDDPAVWIGALYAAGIGLSRLAVPGTQVALVLPVALVWGALAVRRGVLQVSAVRAGWWLTAFGGCALVVLVQNIAGFARASSVGSYLLFALTWAPFALRVRDRSRAAFDRTADRCVAVGLWLSGLSCLFIVLQWLGVAYSDVVARVLPASLVLSGYVTTYPISYGSEIYRSNAWIGLEASVVSFHLGALLVVALVRGRSPLVLLGLALGLLTTASGSGMVVLLVGLVVLVATGRARLLLPAVLPGVALAAVLLTTPFGAVLLGRTGEASSDNSSTTLRAVRGYVEAWPVWRDSVPRQWAGAGPGAAQDLVDATAVPGLVAPTGARLFVDYGLVCGVLLLVVLLAGLHRTWLPALGVGLVASFLTLQPGTTNIILLLALMALVSWWSPVDDGATPAPVGPASGWRRPDPDPADPQTTTLPVPRGRHRRAPVIDADPTARLSDPAPLAPTRHHVRGGR